ncbi:hypothetical protein J2X69_000241 [Algoriphagus sp. 4150]|uniref:TolB family protein n=1 Tax=Algoriphagus sp. 4150 TaxID=2817756 RepID=UPI0028571C26|nr:hypothetical protein [Algoriphagus sp. 4150]MDR7127913.1 hypothetical protein [Algoriphagus sp. 4150]
MKKLIQLSAAILMIALSSGCSNEDEAPVLPGGGQLSGGLYFDWATEGALAINTQTGVRSEFLPYDTKRNGWSLSQDGRIVLTSMNPDIWTDEILFTMTNVDDGQIMKEFSYFPLNGGSKFKSGELSPDNTLVVISSTYEEGVVIIDTSGKLVTHLYDINGEKIELHEQVKWLPGNSLLITHKKLLIKVDPPYKSGTLVKEMNYESWGDPAVDPAGQKIAVRVNNHIYLMNMDGSDFVQVTESNDREVAPVFSPDGKYLLVGTDYTKTGPFGALWYLKIIPADGKVYNVDPIYPNSEGVIPVISNGENSVQAASGAMYWR